MQHKSISLTPVKKSSQIEAIGYHAPSQTLRVRFIGGSEYDYDGVPADVHADFAAAESKGKYLGAHIKGKFAFRKLPQPATAKS